MTEHLGADDKNSIRPITLDEVIQVATLAHEGQTDKGDGGPYIRHPMRVMRAVEPYGEAAQMAAALHDTVEDTDVTLEDLTNMGVPDEVVTAVDALTKREGETYANAIARVKQNPLAILVKLADNRDNANGRRMALLSPERQAKFTAKYGNALAELVGNDPWLTAQAALIEARINVLNELEPTIEQ